MVRGKGICLVMTGDWCDGSEKANQWRPSWRMFFFSLYNLLTLSVVILCPSSFLFCASFFYLFRLGTSGLHLPKLHFTGKNHYTSKCK